MIDIIGKKRWFFILSGTVVLACIIFLGVFGLKPGVDFSPGSELTVSFGTAQVQKSDLQSKLAELGYPEVIIQKVEMTDYLIRLPRLDASQKETLKSELLKDFPTMTVTEDRDVSSLIASETTRNAAIAVAISTIGILLYIAWAFRKMPHPFHYGICAIIALIHDALVALGIFAVFGAIFSWQIDLNFVIGILAVIGYSVNDTVVVFDRLRENLLNDTRSAFSTVANISLTETMSRSLNTSLTTLFVILALMFFVGSPIQNFTFVLLVGIISGTYSSIFLATPLVVAWRGTGR